MSRHVESPDFDRMAEDREILKEAQADRNELKRLSALWIAETRENERLRMALATERERCAKIACHDCAKGIPVVDSYGHVLEWTEGHPSHARECLAKTILNPE